MIERYTRQQLKNIWTDYNRYSIWLEIELAAAEAMEKLKIIPKGVTKKVRLVNFIIDRLSEKKPPFDLNSISG